jgi:hypothetical protein
VKFCIIRRVPFKWPCEKSHIVWGELICSRNGVSLILVPKLNRNGPHSIFIAQENVSDHVFEAMTPIRFDLESDDLTECGAKLKMLGKSFERDEFERNFRFNDDD